MEAPCHYFLASLIRRCYLDMLEGDQPHEPSNAFAAFRCLVGGVRCQECFIVIVRETDPVIGYLEGCNITKGPILRGEQRRVSLKHYLDSPVGLVGILDGLDGVD